MPIHVALPLPRLEPLTYGLPDGIHVQRGCRVLVPLGYACPNRDGCCDRSGTGPKDASNHRGARR
ncbi:MAG: hypothetical protein IPF59_13145 [Ignavibacteria bacterium]|nr:hypothetical protein [Ignavibacteria bacterium]